MKEGYKAVAELAQGQHGLVTWHQAAEKGLNDWAIRELVRRGPLLREHRGVYRVQGSPNTWESRVQAAVLAAGPGALISHRSAAALWRLDGFDRDRRTIHISVPPDRRPRLSGATVHRTNDLAQAGATTRDGFPVTGLARTVLDLAATEPNAQVALRALDGARRRPHQLPWPDFWLCLFLHARQGRSGVATFRALLQKRDGQEPTQSDFEALLLDALIDAGLPAPTPQHQVGRLFIDLAYVPQRIGIECQSRAHHLNEADFERDPVRENRLQLEGWLIIQVTWARLRDDPAGVVAEVREAWARRS